MIKEDPMDAKQLNVLFLCTGNSARSIFAEAIMNKLGGGKFRAFSAGSHPRGDVHPTTIDCLDKARFETAGLRSKSWDEFAAPDAPHMHFVITVCDQAAGEVCPMWPGQPMTAHWGFEDPVAVEGSEEVKLKAFQKAMYQISNRTSIFLSLPMEKLDRLALQEKVRDIGKMPASVEMPDFLKED
jgi:arsenate reductase